MFPPKANGAEYPPSKNGGRTRCTATSRVTSERCARYSVAGGTVCWYHGGAPQVLTARQGFSGGLKCVSLRAKVEAQLQRNDYLCLREELAVLRAMLEVILERLPSSTEDLRQRHFAAAAQFIDAVKACAESMSSIEAKQLRYVSPLYLLRVVDQMVRIADKHLEPAAHAEFADELASVLLPDFTPKLIA